MLACAVVDLEQLERVLRERLDALGPVPRAELLHVLMLPDFDRADRIGEFWGHPESRPFAELLIDCEEDRTFGSCLFGCSATSSSSSNPKSPQPYDRLFHVRETSMRRPGSRARSS